MKVYVVMYAEGEPYAPVTLCICASDDRAYEEMLRYWSNEGYSLEQMYIEVEDVLE